MLTDDFLFQSSVSFRLSSSLSAGFEGKPLTSVFVMVGLFEGPRLRRELEERLPADRAVALLDEGCPGIGAAFAEEVAHLLGMLDRGCTLVSLDVQFCEADDRRPRRTFLHVCAFDRGRTVIWFDSFATKHPEIGYERLQTLEVARGVLRAQVGLPPVKEI